MAQLFVEGFNAYGSDTASQAPMLAGRWANVPGAAQCNVPTFGARTDTFSFKTGVQDDSGFGATRVSLGGAYGKIFVSMGFATTALPNSDQFVICKPRDGSNNTLAGLRLRSDGALILETNFATNNSSGTVIAVTASPVIVAQNWHHLEMCFDLAGEHFELRVDETVVMDVGVTYSDSSVSHSNAFAMNQLAIGCGTPSGPTNMTPWFADLIIRDDTGTRNNDFAGDRRVATLFPNADTAVAGWTPRPRKKFGTGILDNRSANNSRVTAANSTQTDLGSGDFTIEAFVRFSALPAATGKAVFFGKWDEGANKRSYQFYVGGSSVENGNTVFRISTDGQAGTVAEIFSWPVTYDLNTWYHVAVSRASGETMFFVNGVQQGVPFTDSNTYCVTTASTSLGGQDDTTAGNMTNTAFTGFMDEFRFTVGFSRYNTGFTPPVAAFPRSVGGGDANFANVAWLSGFDSSIADESSFGRTLTARNGSVQSFPDDGVYAFQTIDQHAPRDDTFVEAPLIAAFGILTLAANATTTKIVTVGHYTSAGSHPAVYTFKTVLSGAAFEVLIGADLEATLLNLQNAINLGPGAGTTYGTGTIVNDEVTASLLPVEQLLVVANIPGTVGNAFTCTTNDPNASWANGTLTGGLDIPGPSEFSFDRPPNHITVVDSITIISRNFKTDAGTASEQVSFIGPLGTASDGVDNLLTLSPNYYSDTFETDPDTGDDLSPTTLIGGRVRLNRTT